MSSRITIIQGHPDASQPHFGHALADSYAAGAASGGHEVRRIEVSRLGLPLLASRAEWESGDIPDAVRACQEDIGWCRHLLIVYPLWLGDMPAALKAFFEQVFRPGFAVSAGAGTGKKLLKGRTARIVVTMGMPGLVYRWYFGAHSLKSLERNILGFCGIGPVRETVMGRIESGGEARHRKLLGRMLALGCRAA
jgi:putative NADPH-quinone reductase